MPSPQPGISPRVRAVSIVSLPSMEWIEIEAKSALNRVHGMPFRWSLNPYRGCAHACVYCLDGDTPVLMADGTTRPLRDLGVGDEIYGTVRDGWYRHYVKTGVLAHWSTRKPAYRVVLEDGTELIASEDHRFLTDRGWKSVTGADQGHGRRPHLTTGNSLIGVGAFARATVSKTANYRRGYLAGIVRGDGLLGSYAYDRPGRSNGDVHQFRLALVDEDGLRRAQEYLLGFSVPTHRFVFQAASATRHGLHAIRTSARGHVEEIRRLIEWPSAPSGEWRAGWLAGIFDAEGSYSDGVLRITNTDAGIIEWITRSLREFSFAFTVETRTERGPRPLHAVRVRGGVAAHLRLFHTVDPAIARKRDIAGQALKSRARLRVAAIEPVGTRDLFDITTGTGDFIANGVVSHNCYARRTHWFLDDDGVEAWSSRIYVKRNLPEVLRRELARPSWTREAVAVGTATDPYQPAEGRYRITRASLEAFCDFRTPVSIVTKSTMIVRDLDVLRALSRVGCKVFFSVTTVDDALAREIEPDVPPPAKRLRAMQTLVEARVPAGVLVAPVLPGLTDTEENLEAVVREAAAHRAQFLGASVLYLGEVTRDAYYRFLEQKHPDLVPAYDRLFRGTYAPRAYQDQVQRVVAEIKSRHRIRADIAQPRLPRPPEQLVLLP